MEKLTREEYEQLMDLVQSRADEIRKASYSDKEATEEYNNLGMITIKLNTQLTMLKRSLKDVSKI